MDLKTYLKKIDKSAVEFADELGMAFSTIYKICRGKHIPTRLHAKQIHEATLGQVSYKELRRVDEYADI